MTTTLWHIELSHYSEKARWALDHKGVPHRLRTPLVGLHRAAALALTRGRHDRFPVLGLDGRHIGDSTAIVAALEERFPAPPLYPSNPAQRAHALALEDFFDERLGPALRRFAWFHVLADDGFADALAPHNPRVHRVLAAMAPVAKVTVRRDYGADAAHEAAARAEVLAAADRVEAELRPSGYLAGDAFSVADLTAAALFTPVIDPPQRPYLPPSQPAAVLALRDELLARPAGQWVVEMYARHRGV